MPRELTAHDLIASIEFLNHRFSSSDDVHTQANHPSCILVYNEMMNISKEEILSVKDKHHDPDYIYNTTLRIKNPFILSALIKKDAASHLFHDYSHWINQQINNNNFSEEFNLSLYNVIFQIQDQISRYGKNNETVMQETFFRYLQEACHTVDSLEKITVVNQFYDTYNIEFKDYIIKNFMIYCKSPFTNFLMDKLIINEVNINENFPLDKYLPKDRKDANFFIARPEIDNVGIMLDKGLRFNENDYRFGEDNLLTAVLKSGYSHIVSIILPYIKNIVPEATCTTHNHELIEKYKNSEHYPFIKATYEKILLENYLEPAKETKNRSRVKV